MGERKLSENNGNQAKERKQETAEAVSENVITAKPQDPSLEVSIEGQKTELTEEEKKRVEEFSRKIDISDTAEVIAYGSGVQKNLADFSQQTLEKVRTKDMGEVGDMLTNLVTELKNFNVDASDKGIMGFLRRKRNELAALRARYNKVESNVDQICSVLEQHQMQLVKDSAVLDRMYDMNIGYYRELTLYIEAGKQKLEKVRQNDLPVLQKKAQESGSQEDAQKAKDLASDCNRFEKKLYDLELTRTISMQTAPQLRMLQESDMTMAEKIQSTVVNTIPLWKNQMVIAIGMEHAAQAAKAENEVNNMTNELLQKNAEKLHNVTVEAAKESERGIVDVQTLQHTNDELISAIDEIISIQKDGHQKRVEAEQQLNGIEKQLHDKLLEASRA